MPNIVQQLTRKELATFLKDQRQILAFENLFKQSIETQDQEVAVQNPSENKSLQSLSTSLEALRVVKGATVLLWLSM